MKLKFNVQNKSQADPYIFEDNGKFYLYVTAADGVEAYKTDDIFGEWEFLGTVCTVENKINYWAPAIIKYEDRYYLYYSCQEKKGQQNLHVSMANSPEGPFINPKKLYDRFTIDAHTVQTKSGLYLFYTEDNLEEERLGSRLFLDKLSDPYTPMHLRKEILTPSFDEEIYQRNRLGDGRNWHTLEGAFYFKEDNVHYLMYSGGCFMNDTYHIGYAYSGEKLDDLENLHFTKFTDNGKFSPVMIKNVIEEGTGHHSIIKLKNEYYAIYHARDVKPETEFNDRTARICKLNVKNGIITAER